jgi:hypothetical protein
VPLDLHARDGPATLDAALAVGAPLTISPKFWAEHMGLPYHQAAIRPTEIPTGTPGRGTMTRSEGDRSFTRYGYADFLGEDRRYDVVHRIWPGTQRVLLWGDPAFAAAYGRQVSFCGSAGGEVFDPLSFKGRKGSGQPGHRDGYADASLRAAGGDFEKYLLTYRLWGHCLYDPASPAASWERQLRADYGPAAEAAGATLATASRILPLLTTANTPSAANNHFWPELYLNMAIADPTVPVMPYPDTPLPRRFGTVSPLDPQLFATIEGFVDELLADRIGGKYSPWRWRSGSMTWPAADRTTDRPCQRRSPVRSRFPPFAIDTDVQIGLGGSSPETPRRRAVRPAARTGDAPSDRRRRDLPRSARRMGPHPPTSPGGVSMQDMTYGRVVPARPQADRLPAIDQDIAAVRRASSAGVAAAPGRQFHRCSAGRRTRHAHRAPHPATARAGAPSRSRSKFRQPPPV